MDDEANKGKQGCGFNNGCKDVAHSRGGRFGKQDICSKQQGGAKAISNGTMLTRSKCKGRAGRAKPETAAKGQLNPEWVECLMGFPQGWTDIDGPPAPANNTTGNRRGLQQA